MNHGIAYYRIMLPGHLRLLEDTSYRLPARRGMALIYIKSRIFSVSILSHRNALNYEKSENTRHLKLARSIPDKPTDTISCEFQMQDSSGYQKFLCTKDAAYVSYVEKPFTELLVGLFREEMLDNSQPSLEELNGALDRFIELYRRLSADLSVRKLGDLSADFPVVWTQLIRIDGAISDDDIETIINNNWPKEFRPWHFDVAQHGATVTMPEPDRAFSIRFADCLASGMTIPTALSELMRCTQIEDRSRDPKWVLLEAFTIAEKVWNDIFRLIGSVDIDFRTRLERKRHRGSIPAKDAINSLLPGLLVSHQEYADCIRLLDRSRKIRDQVIHHGENSDAVEAQECVDATSRLISASEKVLHEHGLALP